MTKRPAPIVLIVGSGRSGTTFLAKLLDSSPEVLYRHEPDYSLATNAIPFLPEVEDYGRHHSQAREYLEQLLVERSAKTATTLPIFKKSYRGTLNQGLFAAFVGTAKLTSRFGLPLEVPDFDDPGRQRIYLVKSVNSLCRAGLFSSAMPQMKVIHIIRNPCAVIASRLKGQQAGKLDDRLYLASIIGLREAQRYSFSLDDLQALSWEEQAAYAWMVTNNRVYGELLRLPNYRIVRYEDLCLDLMATVERLCGHAQINFSAPMQNFCHALLSKKIAADTYFGVMKKPRASLLKYRSELTEDTQRRIHAIVELSEVGRLAIAPPAEPIPAA